MKKTVLLTLCLSWCLLAYSQDNFNKAKECFDKGNYKCAVRNWWLYQNYYGKDMNAYIQKAETCFNAITTADVLFKEKAYPKASERYKTVMDLNPKDAYAKKQYDICAQFLTVGKTVFADYTETKNNLHFEMVAVQGGTFTMGCMNKQSKDCPKDEKPAHSVTVSDFYIGRYEVTQAQWEAVMENNPSYFKGDYLPVENASWKDVQEFISKVNALTGKRYRLPTEAEWEYACRGGETADPYLYSGSNIINNVAWYKNNSGSKTHFVGTTKANALGIYDMSGNVWEWCSDWYHISYYSDSPQNNPQGPSTGTTRVIRGGCWNSYENEVEVSYRHYSEPNEHYFSLGFRLACSSK